MGFFSSDFNPKFQNTLFLENPLVATADHSAKGNSLKNVNLTKRESKFYLLIYLQ